MTVNALLPSPLALVFSKLDNFLSLMWKGTLAPLIQLLKKVRLRSCKVSFLCLSTSSPCPPKP